jgi:hypothetical protein
MILKTHVIVCPNPECREYSLQADLHSLVIMPNGPDIEEALLGEWILRPDSNAKPMPDYIPESIRNDYKEACAIARLSPKASATLSRRCIQGMIRDFWNFKKSRLLDEINEIQNRVDVNTWKAIDSIRKIGNIGAHMEKDINLIIDVDPSEALSLIGLIEFLIKDWYITRYERNELVNGIIGISKKKEGESNEKFPA